MKAALEAGGHDVICVGIAQSGSWHLAEPSATGFDEASPTVELRLPEGELIGPQGLIDFDVVFPVLHGPFGEDGTIQGALEIAGIPYVGCGVLASALAMEKDIAKRLVSAAGHPTAEWVIVRADDFSTDPARTVDRVTTALALPVFIKPVELGSSIGVTKAHAEGEVKDGIADALRFGDKVIVEEAITGREIEVAVLEGPRASLPGEIVTATEWYDYDAKYTDETSRFVAPADLTDAEIAHVRDFAERVFSEFECRGLARVDFFLEEGGRGFLFNEVNTMPGFTPISGFPKMWEATGMSYEALCSELVRLAR